jgi:hypothetical protein
MLSTPFEAYAPIIACFTSSANTSMSWYDILTGHYVRPHEMRPGEACKIAPGLPYCIHENGKKSCRVNEFGHVLAGHLSGDVCTFSDLHASKTFN